MFPFSRKKRVHKPTPPWLICLVIGFLVYSFFINSGEKTAVTPPNITEDRAAGKKESMELPSSGSIFDPGKILNIDVLKDKFLPKSTMRFHVKDNVVSKGQFAICGHKVTINYKAFTDDNKEIASEQNVSFQIGEGKVMPALEKGVLGMNKNGTRSIFSPGNMAYGTEKFARDDVPALANIRFEVEMLDVSPELPNHSAYRILGDATERRDVYSCGSPVKLHVSIWDVEGNKLYDSSDNGGTPVTFTIGKSEVFLGLEQGVLQMAKGMRRNLIVPPNMQKTLHGNASIIDFHLPKKQTVLIDITSIQ